MSYNSLATSTPDRPGVNYSPHYYGQPFIYYAPAPDFTPRPRPWIALLTFA